jgi:hypothetical protein
MDGPSGVGEQAQPKPLARRPHPNVQRARHSVASIIGSGTSIGGTGGSNSGVLRCGSVIGGLPSGFSDDAWAVSTRFDGVVGGEVNRLRDKDYGGGKNIVFGGEVDAGAMKKMIFAGEDRVGLHATRGDASRVQRASVASLKSGLLFDSRGKTKFYTVPQCKKGALVRQDLGGDIARNVCLQQHLKKLPSWTKMQISVTAALFLLMCLASISSNGGGGGGGGGGSSSSQIFFLTPTPSHTLCSMFSSLGFSCTIPLSPPPPALFLHAPVHNTTQYFVGSGPSSTEAGTSSSQSPILLFSHTQPPPLPPLLPARSWQATFMFYIASGINGGSSTSPPRIYILLDAACTPPVAEATLARTVLLQVNSERRKLKGGCDFVFEGGVRFGCAADTLVQACLNRVLDGSTADGNVGEQMRHNHSDFVSKLRRVALRSVQRLYEEEQQQQNGRHDAAPRMCGVMDWLVRWFNFVLLEVFTKVPSGCAVPFLHIASPTLVLLDSSL